MKTEQFCKIFEIQNKKNKILNELKDNFSYISIDYYRNNGLINDDVIDSIYCEYYIKYCNSENKNRKNLTNFIEDYSLNKDLLHNCFYDNDGMALELISNYLNNFDEKIYYLSKLTKDQLNIARELSVIANYVGINYITNLARYKHFSYAKRKNPDLFDYELSYDDFGFNDYNISRRILVSDGYTYMCLNDINNTKIIEDFASDFEFLWKILDSYDVAIPDLFNSSIKLFLETDN